MDSETTQKDLTPQTRWMNKNNLIRPGIYIPRESWEIFERALQLENFHRAKDGKPPVSRTDVIQAFIEKWSEKRLDLD
ncbi:hypothetical protein ACFL4K_00105 [Candidatus Neomarinimicrobiota bacterium]